MFDLTNCQIGHFSQIDQSKNTHCHSSPWPLIKNTCILVKRTHLVNLINLKKQEFQQWIEFTTQTIEYNMCPIYLLHHFCSHQCNNIIVAKILDFLPLINDRYKCKIFDRMSQTQTLCIPFIYRKICRYKSTTL